MSDTNHRSVRPRGVACLALALLPSLARAQPVASPQPTDPPATGPTAGEAPGGVFHAERWLLDPVPRSERRPLSADRPDATESPYTLDAGAVQLEISFVEYALDAESGGDTSTLDIAPFNLKLGLTEHADVQFLVNPYTRLDTPGDDTAGQGNVTVRLKQNLWGNDGGDFAIAVMPLITLPTGHGALSSDHLEGGVVVPAAWDLSEAWGDGWGVGGQVELGFERNDANTGYDTRLSHTAVLAIPVAPRLGAYAEYIGECTVEGSNYAPSISSGLTLSVNEDTQLDFGLVIGLDNGDTDDVRLFSGLTKRF